MSAGWVFRGAAAAFAVLAILLTALQTRRAPPAAPEPTPPTRPAVQVDPRLARCQALGAAGAQAPACLQAWADQRARFLGGGKDNRRP